MPRSERSLAFRISGLYALFGVVWIVVGDALVEAVYGVPAIVTRLQTWKGWLFVAGSALLLYALVHRELRARVRAEAELRASEARYRRLVDDAPEPVVVTVERRLVFANLAAARLFGEDDVASLLGRYCLDLVAPGERGETESKLLAALGGSGASPRFETRLLRSGGETIDVEVTAAPIHWEGRDAVQVLVRDVSGQRRAAAELARARDEALRASRLKSQFLANMSHEIRTPLNVILGFTSVVRDPDSGLDGPLGSVVAESVESAGKRLLTTIHAILDIAKIESGEFEVHESVVDLCESVRRTAGRFATDAGRKGLAFEIRIEVPAARVRFDEYCLDGAIANLVENAIKFTERGAVTVRLARLAPGGELALEVRDTGVGIDVRYLDHLFEAFSQEEGGYGRRFEGTGLGLALTRHYVERNGARLVVESRKGEGSRFTIAFPGSIEVSADRGPLTVVPRRTGGASV